MLAVCVLPTQALGSAGLEPGVHLDPGSPAETQYVLPLNHARQTGRETGSRQGSGGPFGAGITPPRGGAGGAAGRGAARGASALRRHGASRRSPSGHAIAAPAPAPLPATVVRAARSGDSSAGSGSWLALLGGGLAILVLGGFGGTVLRHNRRPTPSS
jgi:hypothetical protein